MEFQESLSSLEDHRKASARANVHAYLDRYVLDLQYIRQGTQTWTNLTYPFAMPFQYKKIGGTTNFLTCGLTKPWS